MRQCCNCKNCRECRMTTNGRKEEWLECIHPDNGMKVVRQSFHCMYWEGKE